MSGSVTIAAVCLRASKADVKDDDETLTLTTQRRRIAALCVARAGSTPPSTSMTASPRRKVRDAKTQWPQMLSDVGSGSFDGIVAQDRGRLLRTLQDLAKSIDIGAKVATVDGGIDLTTAGGEFRATMLAAVARFEIRRKSERSIGANETRRRMHARCERDPDTFRATIDSARSQHAPSTMSPHSRARPLPRPAHFAPLSEARPPRVPPR